MSDVNDTSNKVWCEDCRWHRVSSYRPSDGKTIHLCHFPETKQETVPADPYYTREKVVDKPVWFVYCSSRNANGDCDKFEKGQKEFGKNWLMQMVDKVTK